MKKIGIRILAAVFRRFVPAQRSQGKQRRADAPLDDGEDPTRGTQQQKMLRPYKD